jgi:type VI protein secretion system component VasF
MPLSEHEQRLLEQMEQALYQEDSKFAQSFRGSENRRRRRRQYGIGAVIFLFGLGALFAGVVIRVPVIGGLGFLVMLGAVMYVLYSTRKQPPLEVLAGGLADPKPPTAPKARRSRRGSFMERIDERWRRRRSEGY